jgi:hypothetical protein
VTARIDRLWPDPAEHLHDDELMDAVDHEAVRLNFVSSIDGAATRDGLSGGLGGPADRRYFALLRRVADVVVVGAGTVRAEGYGPMVVEQPRRGQPVFAIVTRSLELDPASTLFTKAPVKPVIITTERARGKARFEDVADVVVAGGSSVDAALAVDALRARATAASCARAGRPSSVRCSPRMSPTSSASPCRRRWRRATRGASRTATACRATWSSRRCCAPGRRCCCATSGRCDR